MKTTMLFLNIGLLFVIHTKAQNSQIELTFIAENNGQYVSLDSILIENLTQGGDTALYAPDTVLLLDFITNIDNKETSNEGAFSVSQNYPNPFKERTTFNLYLAEKQFIKITVRDILGRKLAKYDNIICKGNNVFAFCCGNEMYYLLTVEGRQTCQTIKMLNAGNITNSQRKCEIVHIGKGEYLPEFKSQKAINEFVFNLGDELKYTGFTVLGERSLFDSPMSNQTYSFQYYGNPCPGTPTITDIDGNVYNTVLIGSQCWMAENLKTTTYRNETPVPNVTGNSSWSSLTTGAYAWYDNNISWKESYGALYNWFAVIDPNGLCPSGWHVPTNDEWTILTDFIGGTVAPYGNELKSCRQVNSPLGEACNTAEHPRWYQHGTHYGTDDHWFSGLPGGSRHFLGNFVTLSYIGSFWSSTGGSPDNAWLRGLNYNDGSIDVFGFYKKNGYSVRCLRD